MVTVNRLGTRKSPPDPKAMPAQLHDAEEALIAGRRTDDPARLAAGLAISGGGIRSATFALGVLQALQDLQLLSRFDYLSTVSGGGYIGSFLGSLFIEQKDRELAPGAKPAVAPGPASATGWARVESALAPQSPELRWLRDNGRYLSPNGAGDSWLAGAVILRNWAAVQIVLATFLSAVFSSLTLVRACAERIPRVLSLLPSAGAFKPSPLFLAPALTAALWVIPAGWAYWLLPADTEPDDEAFYPRLLAVLVCVGAAVAACWTRPLQPWTTPWFGCAVVSLLTLLLGGRMSAGADGDRAGRGDRGRNVLSGFLKAGLLVTLGLATIALIDSLGQLAFLKFHAGIGTAWLGAGIASVFSIATFGNKLAKLLAPGDAGAAPKGVRLPVSAVALVVALLLAAAMLTALSAATYALAWHGSAPLPGAMHRGPLAALALSTLLASYLMGQAFTFINRSSQASFYADRLTRAYLGASNLNRLNGEGKEQSVTQVIAGDEIPFARYRPERKQGPLHLINVTLNETMDGRSQIEQQDRKGMVLALGPAGVSVGVRHHARWIDGADGLLEPVAPIQTDPQGPRPFRVFEPRTRERLHTEPLSLGRWMAISGAAFSTGLGFRTSLGLSLLCGIFNIRLGHWWWSDTEPERRAGEKGRLGRLRRLGQLFSRAFPVQSHLFDELLARFPGTARRHWYLSDGGHFENTACYELIRRRVPFIVLIDDGEDAAYRFDDLSQLVRKARLDFGAKITFLTDELLDEHLDQDVRRLIGPISTISATRKTAEACAWSRRCAALGLVEYAGDPNGPASLLLVLKPALVGDEPQDVIQYALANPDFPQQSTANQYFDEAQWESYRQLGEHVARKLFKALPPDLAAARWRPSLLSPAPILPG